MGSHQPGTHPAGISSTNGRPLHGAGSHRPGPALPSRTPDAHAHQAHEHTGAQDSSVSDLGHDEMLFTRLRQLRKTLADEADVPAYVIFSDVALRQMARDYPTNEQEFLQISGVGNRKLQEFGPKFLAVIAGHLENYAPLTIPKESNPPPAPAGLIPARRRRLEIPSMKPCAIFGRGIRSNRSPGSVVWSPAPSMDTWNKPSKPVSR